MLCFGSCLCFNYPLTPIVLPICSWIWSHHGWCTSHCIHEEDWLFLPQKPSNALNLNRAPEALQTPCPNADWCVILHRDHSWYEGMGAMVPPCPEDTLSSSPAFDFLPCSGDGPWALRGLCKCAICDWALHWCLNPVSWPVMTFCINHYPALLKEKSLMWSESCTNL